MTRSEYIEALRRALAGSDTSAAEELIKDVEEHFDEAAEAGLDEATIAERLGDPMEMARELTSDAEGGAPASTATLGSHRSEYESVTALRVALANSDVEIFPSADEKTYVDITDNAVSEEDKIETLVENGQLIIRQRRKYRGILALFGMAGEQNSARVWLGKGFAGLIDAGTSSGRLSAVQVSGSGVKLSTASGKISAEDVSADTQLTIGCVSGGIEAVRIGAPEVKLNSASGSIKVDGVKADSLRANAASGSLNVHDARCGGVNLNTASGSIRYEGVPTCPVRAAAASGSITLRLPADSELIINATVGSGAVNIGFPGAVDVSTDKHRRRFVVGGGKVTVGCTTGSGKITVEPIE